MFKKDDRRSSSENEANRISVSIAWCLDCRDADLKHFVPGQFANIEGAGPCKELLLKPADQHQCLVDVDKQDRNDHLSDTLAKGTAVLARLWRRA